VRHVVFYPVHPVDSVYFLWFSLRSCGKFVFSLLQDQSNTFENFMTTAIKSVYEDLVEKLEEISRLGGVMSTLHWDQEVIMPSGAAKARAKQISALAGVIHEKATDPRLG